VTRPLVVQTEELDDAAAAWLAEHCELVACPLADASRLDALLARADGVVVRTYTRVDAAFLDRAPRLRVVARAGVGLDRIDVAECRRRGAEVVHTPDANSSAVAEYVFAMLLDLLRPLHRLDAPLSAADWTALRRRLEAPRQLEDLTLGVWGLGRVGGRVARAGVGLGMRVVYHDLVEIPVDRRHGATPVDRDGLLATADVVTVHVDPRPANRRLVGAEAFARMRSDVVFVNTSRGVIVDAAALAAFCRAHPDARALVDVHDPEPIPADYPLLGLPTVRLSPHAAAATARAHANMSWVVRDVWRVLSGEPPAHPAPA